MPARKTSPIAYLVRPARSFGAVNTVASSLYRSHEVLTVQHVGIGAVTTNMYGAQSRGWVDDGDAAYVANHQISNM